MIEEKNRLLHCKAVFCLNLLLTQLLDTSALVFFMYQLGPNFSSHLIGLHERCRSLGEHRRIMSQNSCRNDTCTVQKIHVSLNFTCFQILSVLY